MENYRDSIVQYINENFSMNSISINGTYVETKTLDVFIEPDVKISTKSDNRFAQAMVENVIPLCKFLQQNSQVLLVGGPGSGKTTILKYLALLAASEKNTPEYGIKSNTVPVYISLAAFCNQSQSIRDYIITVYKKLANNKEGIETYIKTKMDNGEILILLDGLNDIPLDIQRQVFLQINSICTKNPETKIVITTRNIQTITFSKTFVVTKIQNFNSDKIEKYAELIIGSEIDDQQKVRESKLKFINAVSKNSSLYQLAQNPLFLSILVIQFNRQKELPKTRIELYNAYIDDLISSVSIEDDEFLSKDGIIRVLAYIAYNVMKNNSNNTFISTSVLKGYIISFFEKKIGYKKWDALQKTQLFLDNVLGKIGIFTYEAESGGYSIKQVSIKEYLSALNICFDLEDYIGGEKKGRYRHKEIVDILLPNEMWHEILKLVVEYIAVVNNSLCDPLEMVSYALKCVFPWSSDLQVKCSLIAGECLVTIANERAFEVASESVVNCQNKMLEILGNPSVSSFIHIGAARVLSYLGDPRIIDVPELVYIHPGSFIKGAEYDEIQPLIDEASKVELDKDDLWIQDYWKEILLSEVFEKKEVTIQKPYRISKYPITNLQYQVFLNENPEYPIPGWGDDKKGALYTWKEETRSCNPAYNNSPVVLVSWHDANKYCEWLSRKTGRTFRLPSEDEWEYAARGTDSKKYPWGNEWKDDYANTLESGLNDIVPVGCFEQGKSSFGLLDCSGQIWEWTNTEATQLWKKAWPSHMRSSDDTEAYIVRGGAWDDISVFARCSSRGPNGASFYEHYIGFRIVEEL